MNGRAFAVWAALIAALSTPIILAATSPFLAWRDPIYIAAGFAGVVAMVLLLLQPLLAGGYLPGLTRVRARRLHRWTGGGLIAAIILHVGGLWLTSPPDVIDALLFRSPTPFSAWGVIAMWAALGAAALALFRRRLRLAPRHWRLGHLVQMAVVALGCIIHALLIEGAMEPWSKLALSALIIAAVLKLIRDLWHAKAL